MDASLGGCVIGLGDERSRQDHPYHLLPTDPDGLFATWQTFQTNRLRMIGGSDEGCVELEGTPDMVLEVVSRSSVRKDTELLRGLYWQAGVPEYWLVNARSEPLQFAILRHGSEGYEETIAEAGWRKSTVFDRSFCLTQGLDPLGQPQYTVSVR